jgi:hypothetical protein
MASLTAARSSIDATTYALRAFLVFLQEQRLSLSDVTDEVIITFREVAFKKVVSNPRNRGGITFQTRETVNIKLRHIYDFLHWCQKTGEVPPDTIGWQHCKVRSSLPLTELGSSDNASRSENKYPQCFRGEGENAPRDGQYWATVEDIDRIEQGFWERGSEKASLRNATMLRILQSQLWRIGSANSLLTTQFSSVALERQRGQETFSVIPPDQKGGKSYPFAMEWPLAESIHNYINNDVDGRKSVLSAFSIGENIAKHRVFLSVRSGKPLSTATWVRIISSGFRDVGAPKGAGAHAVRRGGSADAVMNEVAYRQAEKLEVSEDAVAGVMQQRLGHSRRESQRSYRRVERTLRRKSRIGQLEIELLNTRQTISDLREELASAKRQSDVLARRIEILAKPLLKGPRRQKIKSTV